jgi:two-component system LytT family sensor kinase
MNAIKSGEIKIIKNKKEFNCKSKNCNCPLESAVIVPLFNKNKVIGSLKFYETKKGGLSKEIIKLASGIGKLLTMQIELANLDRQTQLATKAKLDALQTQVNPHFLFNALSTINMYIMKNPEYARKLIVKLSTILRYLLSNYGHFITLEEEISYIKDYVVIENARFNDKLKIIYDIGKSIKNVKIPVFTVQPLLQNAIIHGILPKENTGKVKISACKLYNEILISVTDNGIGIKEENLKRVYEHGFGTGCGVGIPNVNERLKILYGEKYGLKIESKYKKGTKVYFKIPIT